jgi:hypothetical protein
MGAVIAFKASIQRPPGTGTWHYVDVPCDTVAAFGSKGQIKVRGALNAIPFRSTLLPTGDGAHYLVVGKELRDQAGADVGDEVAVSLELDDAPRTVELHPALAAALEANPAVGERFRRMAYSHQKRWNESIVEAKKDETRVKRIEKLIEDLSR